MRTLKLACSNLAWDPERLHDALTVLQREGFSGVEIAPTHQWGDWENATVENAQTLRRTLGDRGLVVPALQSILFKRPDLKLFDRYCWPDLVLHMERVARLAEALGAGVLVLGAPRQRRIDPFSDSSPMDVAADILMVLAKVCHQHGVILCIEPNARRYGCDFVWQTEQAVELVKRVAHPGFGLHLDAAAMSIEGETPAETIRSLNAEQIRHYHVSEPDLKGLSHSTIPHLAAFEALAQIGYAGWVSLESTDKPDFEKSIRSLGNWTRNYRHAA